MYMLKNKKGQFYILFAVLIIVIIMGLVTTANYARKANKPVKFYDLSEDFEAETIKIIDYGVFNSETITEGDIKIQLRDFVNEYLEYAQKKDKNLQLLYIYGDENGVVIDNYAFDEMTTQSQEGQEV